MMYLSTRNEVFHLYMSMDDILYSDKLGESLKWINMLKLLQKFVLTNYNMEFNHSRTILLKLFILHYNSHKKELKLKSHP